MADTGARSIQNDIVMSAHKEKRQFSSGNFVA